MEFALHFLCLQQISMEFAPDFLCLEKISMAFAWIYWVGGRCWSDSPHFFIGWGLEIGGVTKISPDLLGRRDGWGLDNGRGLKVMCRWRSMEIWTHFPFTDDRLTYTHWRGKLPPSPVLLLSLSSDLWRMLSIMKSMQALNMLPYSSNMLRVHSNFLGPNWSLASIWSKIVGPPGCAIQKKLPQSETLNW